MHTIYGSPLGQRNWLQSRAQFQFCYTISRCASMAACPTIGDIKSLNKLARQIKSQPVKLQYWPLTGPLRILVFLDASFRNNDDGSSQRGMTVFLAESRERSSKDGMSYGSLVDCESQKIKEIVLSTTVAELYSFYEVFWFMPISLWIMDGSIWCGCPLQKETIHIISVLRKEACSGSIHHLAHSPTEKCLADCSTKAPAMADNLITAVQTGKLLDVDTHIDVENPCGAPGFLVNLMRNVITHKRKGSLPREQTIKISCAIFPRRTISGADCRWVQQKKSKKIRIHESVRVRIPRKYRLCTQSHASNFLGQWCRFR